MRTSAAVFLATFLLHVTAAPGAQYVYETRGTGQIAFTARVTLSYNRGFVTDGPEVFVFDTSAPIDSDTRWFMLGGTVTPTSITQTGFLMTFGANHANGFNDNLVFDQLLQLRWTNVPEPSTAALFLAGVGLMALRLHRTRLGAGILNG